MRALLLTPVLMLGLLASGSPALAHGEGEEVSAGDLYHEYCSVCHGDRGDGRSRARAGLRPPPRDFTEVGLKDRMTRQQMIQVVNHGKPGTAMAAWRTRLDPDEVAAIVDYIRDEFMRSAGADHGGHDHGHDQAGSDQDHAHDSPTDTAAGHHDDHGNVAGADVRAAMDMEHDHETGHLAAPTAVMSAPFPNGLMGDAQRGRELYSSNCVPCHGRDGSGDGPRAKFIFPKPRDFTQGPPISRPDLFHGIRIGVRGREMPAWGFVFSDQQIAHVAEYVFQEFEQPRLEDDLLRWRTLHE